MDAEAVGFVGLSLDVTLLEDTSDVHCGLGSILEEGGKSDVIMGRCGGGLWRRGAWLC